MLSWVLQYKEPASDLGKDPRLRLSTAAIAIIISAAQPFGWVLTLCRPRKRCSLFSRRYTSPMAAVRPPEHHLSIVGCFMEGTPSVMAIPVILPFSRPIDLVHFGSSTP
jgi:TRAP-type C4-dicarboxylate transport system permease large subunit